MKKMTGKTIRTASRNTAVISADQPQPLTTQATGSVNMTKAASIRERARASGFTRG